MRSRTLVVCQRAIARRVRDMAFVVWAIEVDAVPARGEDNGGANAAGARLVGECGGVVGGAGRATAAGDGLGGGEAAVADSGGFGCRGAEGGVAGEHAEALFS
jgi:hypothetical protein